MCVKNREPIFANKQIGAAAVDVIMRQRRQGRYYLHAYCVMPDHVHLLLKLREHGGPFPVVVAVIKAGIRHAARPHGVVTWMRGFHERVKREYERADEYVKYILLNPVRAGLVREAADYPYVGCVDPY